MAKKTKEQLAAEIGNIFRESGLGQDELLKCLGLIRTEINKGTSTPNEEWRNKRGGPLNKGVSKPEG